MAIPFLSSIDLNLNELQNCVVQNLAAAPAHKAGRIYYNTATGLFGFSDGTNWKYVEVGGLDMEALQDGVAAMLAASTVVTATYNDSTGAITLSIGAGQVTNTMLATGINADKLVDGTTNGVFTLANRTKLTGIATGATANDTDANLKARGNHTGTQSADTLTDGSTNRIFITAEKTKLAGIATAATANDTDANLKNRANHTGTQTADTITDGTTNKAFTATEKTKLAGVATGATANAADSALRDRTTHTGTQPAATISDFNAAVDTRIAALTTGAPAALDTLDELAAALGDDANFAANITALINLRAKTFSQDVGDGTTTAIVVTHNLNTRDVQIACRQTGAPYAEVWVENEATTLNTVTLRFAVAPTTAQYRVIVQGR